MALVLIWYITKKQTLPSIDMNRKWTVRSLYTTQLILSVKAATQKTLAIDLLLGIMCALWWAPYAGPGKGCGASKTGKTGEKICGTGTGASRVLGPCGGDFGFVLLIPFFGLFICPFAVAGLGFKYFVTSSLPILGHPMRKPLRNAFKRKEIFGLHSN